MYVPKKQLRLCYGFLRNKSLLHWVQSINQILLTTRDLSAASRRTGFIWF